MELGERSSAGDHPPSSARALPAPLQLLRGAGALPGASGRSAVWGRPDGGLDIHPAPPHTHTHIHSHSRTRSTSDTHTPAPAAFFTHPLAHLTLHTSLLTASRCACPANRVPSRACLLGRMLFEDTHPHLTASPTATAAPDPDTPGCALWAHPLLQNTHIRRHSIPFPRPG